MDCMCCGKELTGRQRKFCTDKCSYTYGNRLKAKARADALGVPVGHKPCATCGALFEYSHNGIKFCSTQCRLARKQKYAEQAQSKDYNASLRAKRYGITLEQLEALEEACNHQCQICGMHEKDAPKGRLHVDHCHETGQVRGLLCCNCNQGLGKFQDKVALLNRASEYLAQKM